MYVLLGWSVKVRKIHSPHYLTSWKQCPSFMSYWTEAERSLHLNKEFQFSSHQQTFLCQSHWTKWPDFTAVSWSWRCVHIFLRSCKDTCGNAWGGLWLLSRPTCTLSKTKLESVFHCVGTFPGCREGWDLWLDRIRGLLLLRNSHCEREFWLLRLLEPWQEVGRDVLGFHSGAAAPFRFPSLVQSHVPLSSRVFSSVNCWGIGVVAVFLKSLPELAVICKFGLGGGGKQTFK